MRVPGERADAIAAPDAERRERVREPGGAPREVGVGVAEAAGRGAAHDRAVGEQRRRALENARDRELGVHHQSAHGDLLEKSISSSARRSGVSRWGWCADVRQLDALGAQRGEPVALFGRRRAASGLFAPAM